MLAVLAGADRPAAGDDDLLSPAIVVGSNKLSPQPSGPRPIHERKGDQFGNQKLRKRARADIPDFPSSGLVAL